MKQLIVGINTCTCIRSVVSERFSNRYEVPILPSEQYYKLIIVRHTFPRTCCRFSFIFWSVRYRWYLSPNKQNFYDLCLQNIPCLFRTDVIRFYWQQFMSAIDIVLQFLFACNERELQNFRTFVFHLYVLESKGDIVFGHLIIEFKNNLLIYFDDYITHSF